MCNLIANPEKLITSQMLTSVLLICVGKTQRVRIPREAILANAMKVSFNKTGVVLVSYCP